MKGLTRVFVWIALGFLVITASASSSGNPYDKSNNDNDSSTNNTNNNSSNSNTQLLQEINKKTSKGLKVFDKLIQDRGQSKEDFFANVGSDPTASQFEGDGGDGGGPVVSPFAKIIGSDDSNN